MCVLVCGDCAARQRLANGIVTTPGAYLIARNADHILHKSVLSERRNMVG